MTAQPTPPETSTATLETLLQRCRTLCENASSSLADLPASKQEFLVTNLRDALQHLELILRVLDKETGREEEPQGFLSRLTRSIARREKEATEGGKKDEVPDLHVSQQGLQGNSWTIPLPELIGFLAYGRKTGVLWVDAPTENFLIGLEEGRLMHATSDRTPEGLRLGEVLVGLGFLTRRQLERYLATSGKDEKVLTGETLLEAGMINEEELQSALTHQVQQLFHRLLETRNAIFKFREGMQVALAYQVDLNVPKLLLESARVRDERSSERSLEAIVGQIAAASSEGGVPDDWSSWNREMLTELERIVLEEADKKDGAAEPAAAASGSKPAAAGADKAADAKAGKKA